MNSRRLLAYLVILAASALVAAPAFAQLDGLGSFGAAPPQVVKVSGEFTAPAVGKPGYLFLTAKIKSGWHIYSITQPAGGPVKTQIVPDPSNVYRLLEPFRPIQEPEKKVEPLFDNITVESHHNEVTWYAPLELAAGVDPKTVTITGKVMAQPCDANSCLAPQDFSFTAGLGAGKALATAVPQTASGSAPVAAAATPIDWSTLGVKLVFAFIGGLILNVMPCVLPVISLKLLSFVQQSGESRARVFLLNVWYALGEITVFMLLAALAATAGLAWGEQFTLPWFKVGMTALVFAMALSFLGVWEIPIPGFVGAGTAGELQAKEGPSGAFFKGVFATILATPCSGPFLGPVFGYLLTQPPVVAYLIFGSVGLGMAAPYLVIGAIPALIRLLPRPGAWMDTFKQLMAFLLLGTVVYLFSTLSAMHFLPTLTLLIGIWFACWLIGRTPLTVEPSQRAAAWGGGIAVAALTGVFAFTVLLHEPKIAWQPFTPDALAAARSNGKTVLVDFSADWCLTCKANLKFAVDTERVKQVVEKNKVVPLLADWTDRSPSIKEQLNKLGANSIPLLVVWPPEGEPIILPDLLQESDVLAALEQAGPSKPEPLRTASRK